MKIALVTNQLGPGYVQGTERYVEALAQALRERGHEVLHLAGDPQRLHPRTPFGRRVPCGGDGVPVLSYPATAWTTVLGPSPAIGRRWLRRMRPDVVHIANPAHVGIGIGVAARSLGVPTVVTVMDYWWVCPKATLLRPGGEICDGTPGFRDCVRCVAVEQRYALVRGLGRLPAALAPLAFATFALRSLLRGAALDDVLRWTRRRPFLVRFLERADAVIFPSPATRAAIAPRLGHARWHTIPYGLPDEWFEAPRPAPGAPRDPADLVIGYAGALLPHKAPHLLLEAVKRLGWRSTRVRLAGPAIDPGYLGALRQAADGLRVEFAGMLDVTAMRTFLRSLDIAVIPSTWPENLPLVALEAGAAGVQVVAGDVPGIRDAFADPRLLFARGSSADLARALAAARETPRSLGLGRPSRAREMAERTEAVYALALARRRPVAEPRRT